MGWGCYCKKWGREIRWMVASQVGLMRTLGSTHDAGQEGQPCLSCVCVRLCMSAIHGSWGQQFSSKARRERRAGQGRGRDWGLRTHTCGFTWTIDAIKRSFLQISVTVYMRMFATSDVSRLLSILENVYLLRAGRTKFNLIILLSANLFSDSNKCITIKFVCNKH